MRIVAANQFQTAFYRALIFYTTFILNSLLTLDPLRTYITIIAYGTMQQYDQALSLL
jgi:hypothetical protein